MLDDVLFYGVLGVIAGGRLGYVLFYKRWNTWPIRSTSSSCGKAA